MEFFDIVRDTCDLETGFSQKLGFKHINRLNPDQAIDVDNKKDPQNAVIAYGTDISRLISSSKKNARSIIISNAYVDNKLLEIMKENSTILCIPVSSITSSYGLERAKRIFRWSKLVHEAGKRKVDIAYITFAETPLYMCSYMQLLSLAMLLNGGIEQQARLSMSQINKRLCE